MEELIITEDKNLFCVTASSFPEGIPQAFDVLTAKIASPESRTFYGISRPEKGIIIYKAAVAEAFDGEAEQHDLETFVMKKGTYIAETIEDWQQDEASIGNAFRKLLADSRLDQKGACIEKYINDRDVVCMVRLDDNLI